MKQAIAQAEYIYSQRQAEIASKKIEKQMMDILPKNEWDAGMAMSFLGREICRPTKPKCKECVMNSVCMYYNDVLKKLE